MLVRKVRKESSSGERKITHLCPDAEIQLKILQALPSLLQNYGDQLTGDLIGSILLICSNLQGSKAGVVHSTAAATLQQLVVAVFDKLVNDDGTWKNSWT